MNTQSDLQDALIEYQNFRQSWQEMRRKHQDTAFQCRRLLETLTDPLERQELEDIVFESLQGIETAEAEIQLYNEKIASVQRMQQNMDEAEGKQAAIVIAVVMIFIIVVLFMAMR